RILFVDRFERGRARQADGVAVALGALTETIEDNQYGAFRGHPFSTSGAVVGLAANDAVGAVELFEDNKTSEAVRQRQATERPDEVGATDELARQTVGAADRESDPVLATVHGARQLLRQLVGAELLAALVERPQLVPRREL